jgi:hypothetical protein
MKVARPSRYQVTKIYGSRAINWRRNSSPFISGDAFADLSDYVAFPPKNRNPKQKIDQLASAKVIFCRSDRLQEFFSEYQQEISAKVIVAGNSDFEFHVPPERIPKSVDFLLLQNSFISDDIRFSTLPIGLENLRLGMNGKPRNFYNPKNERDRNDKVLFGPFSNTHRTRTEVAEIFSEEDYFLDLLTQRMTPKEMSSYVRKYKYVAAVRGNGVDTHRMWESLYLGASPIVCSDKWSESLRALRLPLLYVDEWSLESVKKIVDDGSFRPFNPKDLQALWMDYWVSKIKSHI